MSNTNQVEEETVLLKLNTDLVDTFDKLAIIKSTSTQRLMQTALAEYVHTALKNVLVAEIAKITLKLD